KELRPLARVSRQVVSQAVGGFEKASIRAALDEDRIARFEAVLNEGLSLLTAGGCEECRQHEERNRRQPTERPSVAFHASATPWVKEVGARVWRRNPGAGRWCIRLANLGQEQLFLTCRLAACVGNCARRVGGELGKNHALAR